MDELENYKELYYKEIEFKNKYVYYVSDDYRKWIDSGVVAIRKGWFRNTVLAIFDFMCDFECVVYCLHIFLLQGVLRLQYTLLSY